MKKLVAAVIGVLWAVTSLPAQNPGQVYSTPTVPTREALERLNLKLAWYSYLPMDGRRDGIYTVQILDGQLLFGLRSGAVISLDPATGAMQWQTRVGLAYVPPVGLGANSTSVFLAKGVRMFSLDRGTGNLQWEVDLPNAATAAAVSDDEHIFIPAGTNRLLAFVLPKPRETAGPAAGADQKGETLPSPAPKTTPESIPSSPTKTGSVLGLTGQYVRSVSAVSSIGQSVRAIGPLSSAFEASLTGAAGTQPKFLWAYQTETKPETRLEQASLLTSDFLFQVGANGLFFTLSKFNPRIFYRFQSDASVSAALGQYRERKTDPETGRETDRDIAYVPSEDFRVYALEIVTGTVLWRFTTGGPILLKPRITDDSVYVTAARVGLYRIDRRTGEMVWRNGDADRFLAVNNKFVYATDRQGRLLILDRARGSQLAIYDGARDFHFPIGNELTDRIYLASNDGLLLCLHDRDYLTPLRVNSVEDKKSTIGPTEGKKTGADKGSKKPDKSKAKDEGTMPEK